MSKKANPTTAAGETVKSGGLDFAVVKTKLKNPADFFSLDGKTSKGEYWATVLMLSIPLDVLFVLFAVIASCLDPSGLEEFGRKGGGNVVLFTFPMGMFTALAGAFMAISNLVMFPAMVRRLRDARITPLLGVFALAVAAVPYLGYASAAIIFTVGFLPAKADVAEPPAGDSSSKIRIWILAVVFSALAAAMTGSMIASSITQDNFVDKFGKTFDRVMRQVGF